ncbi:MAG: 30S ribosomal protein S18 [Geobacteraceae bacterium]|nr:30S ribosomal protein S18 [Geobacteraceae bacterium]
MSTERTPSRGPGGPRKKRNFQRRKICRFCADKQITIDYKDPRTLRSFISERGKIVPRRISGNCAKHQRQITEAIKRARNIALLPIAAGHVMP